jgi:transposase
MARKKQEPADLDALGQINPDAAGMDIGSEEIFVAVPKGRDTEVVRSFPTFTADLYRLAEWLEQCRVTTVAMESTGVYWIPVYEILEQRGFEVYLVNARHLKNVPGKKTDVMDCQWIQQLHTYGLLRASFRPVEEICSLRVVVRHRDMLVKSRSRHILHMHKALQMMNIQLTQVVSDITGVTGMKIIRAIIDGARDPRALAAFRDPRCAHSEEEIARALEGHYRREHLFSLRQAVELYDFYCAQIGVCDAELEDLYAELNTSSDDTPPTSAPCGSARRKRNKNDPTFDLTTSLYRMVGVDCTRVPVINALTMQVVVSEIGVDMSRWPTYKHLQSWLGTAPQNEVTGGKVKRRGTRKTSNRAATALKVAAQGAWNSPTEVGDFFRRIKRRHGPQVAITATANKLARIIYTMIKNKQEYVEPGQGTYERRHQERVLRNLKRRAKRLGYRLTPTEEAVVS